MNETPEWLLSLSSAELDQLLEWINQSENRDISQLVAKLSAAQVTLARPASTVINEWAEGDIRIQEAIEEMAARYQAIVTQEKRLDAEKEQIRTALYDLVATFEGERTQSVYYELSISRPKPYTRYDPEAVRTHLSVMEQAGMSDWAQAFREACERVTAPKASIKLEIRPQKPQK